MAIKRQEWTPDTLSGVTFVEEYDDTDYDGTVTCIEVKDVAGTRATSIPAQAASAWATHLDNNKFKNLVLLPEMAAAVHPSDRSQNSNGDNVLNKTARFYTDATDDVVLDDNWQPDHPSSRGLAVAAIATAKNNRTPMVPARIAALKRSN